MKKFQSIIQKYITNHQKHKKYLAAVLALSMLVSFGVSAGLVMPAVSMTKPINNSNISKPMIYANKGSSNSGNIPPGAIDLASYIDYVEWLNQSVPAVDGKKNVSLFMSFVLNDANNLPTQNQPYVYLKLPKDDIDVTFDYSGVVADSTDEWKEFKTLHNVPAYVQAGTYTIYKTADDFALILIKWNPEYIDFIQEAGHVKGSLTFNGDVGRADTQEGDKNVHVGDEQITIDFDSAKPSIDKTGKELVSGSDLYVQWTVTIHDVFELSKYSFNDMMLDGSHEVRNFVCTPPVFEYDSQYGVMALYDSTSADTITITYETKVTRAELSQGKVKNKAYVDGLPAQKEVEVTLDVDSKGHVQKTGQPSYVIEDEKGYIEWTLDVYRDFDLPLGGYTVNDEKLTQAGIISIVDENGNDVKGQCNIGNGTLTFSEDADFSRVKIKYKTTVDKNSKTTEHNNASILPPNSDKPDDTTPDIPVDYNGDALFDVEKKGTFHADNTGDNDYIEWQITIDATKLQNSKINLNGYTISDSYLSDDNITKVEAYNDGIWVSNTGSLLTKSGNGYIVNSSPEVDKIVITYRAPLTEAQQEARKNLQQGQYIEVDNTVTVDDNDGGTDTKKETVKVPGVAGDMSVSAGKNWVGNDPNRQTNASKQVTLRLLRRRADSNVWTEVTEAGTKTVNSGETVTWENLPERDTDKTEFYYKVEEVNPPNDYEVSYNPAEVHSDGYNKNPNITVTNTWKKANMGVVKYWNGIDDESKPDKIRFKLEKSTDKQTWETVETIELTKPNYNDKNFSPQPKKDEKGNTIYYRVVEVDENGNEVKDFDVNGAKWEVDLTNQTDDYYFNITNTWRNMNLYVNKTWAGDEGHTEKRPNSVTFTLWKKVGNGNWEKTNQTVTINKSDYGKDVNCFKNLPRYTDDGQEIEYKVVEEPVNGYYPTGEDNSLKNSGTINITNNYNFIQIEAEKQWNGIIPDSAKPDKITLRLMKASSAWAADNEWQPAGVDDIIINKSENFPKGVWDNLPKRDENGNPIYYKVVEVLEAPYDKEFTASYNNSNGINENGKFIITNTWNYMSLKANKKWVNATPETMPDEIVLTLKKLVEGSGTWTDITDKDKQGLWAGVTSQITLKKADDGKYYLNGSKSQPADSYEWGKLPTKTEDGLNITYKVEETYVPGYDVGYSSALGASGEFNITNTSNFIDVTVTKGWKDVNSTQRPEKVVFRLLRATGNTKPESEWEVVYESYEVNINKDGDYTTWTWKNLPGKNSKGNKYFYKVEEVYIYKDGNNVKNEYSMTCSPEYASLDNKNLTVTNTWKKMNLGVQKRWVGFDDIPIPATSVTVRLQQKIGESGDWEYVEGQDPVIINTNNTNTWTYENVWTELPKTTTDGKVIYYRAVEDIPEGVAYFAEYDETGKKATGTSVVTNKANSIDITVKKVWDPDPPIYASKTSSVTFYLQRTTNGGASWQNVDYNGNGVFDDADKITLTGDEEFNAGKMWKNLPIKEGNKNIIYRVVEETVDGFSASYSIDGVNFKSSVTTNDTSTVTVKNTERSPYTKYGISSAPNPSDYTLGDQTPTSDIKPDALEVVNIDGKDYYIFKWRINLERNMTNGGGVQGMLYEFEDTLPENTILYIGEIDGTSANYGSLPEYAVSVAYKHAQGTLVQLVDKGMPLSVQGYAYDEGNRKIYFYLPDNVSFVTYYTATLKSTVDEALEKDGEFILENKIKEKAEEKSSSATITVSGGEDADYIEKMNKTPADYFDGTAYYEIEINKDGRFLSNGKNVTLTDIFHILRYQEKEGEEQQGRNLLDVSLDNITVYEVDDDGKRTPIDDWSYSTEEKDGIYSVEKPNSSFSTGNTVPSGNGLWIAAWTVNQPKGLEVEIQITGGTPYADILFADPTEKDDMGQTLYHTSFIYKDGTGEDAVKLEQIDTQFDADGKGKIKLTVLKDWIAPINIGTFGVNGVLQTSTVSIVKQVIVENSPVTDDIINLTVPDGKHLIVEYQYKFKRTDGEPLGSGDMVVMNNSATLHTSGGDKSDTSDESKFVVSDSIADASTNLIPKIKKIDSGNYSIKNLEATFKLARWDVEKEAWEYATKFLYREYMENGKLVTSKTDHKPDYGTPDFAKAGDLRVEKGSYNIELESGTLYKLVEVKSPNGYLETDFERKGTIESANDTYYFLYNGDLSSITNKPAEVTDSEVQIIEDLGTVTIGNVKPIEIGAEKTWEQTPSSKTDVLEGVYIIVQLYSSLTKSSSIPEGALPVENAKDYVSDVIDPRYVGNDGTVKIFATKDPTTGALSWKEDVIWQGLPNGKNGKPIYYYVKEVAYSINNVEYELTDSGRFVSNAGTEGLFRPTYSDNGTNENTVVGISNSKILVVKKKWLKLNGDEMTNPPDVNIEFILYGITESGEEVQIVLDDKDSILNADNEWQVEIPQELIDQYVRFKIVEVNPMDSFTVSDVYEINGTVGIITLINQDKTISDVDVQVKKHWGDGDDVHTNDKIEVTLYKSLTHYTNEQIKGFETKRPTVGNEAVRKVETIDPENPIVNPQILNAENQWTYTWNNLPYKETDSNGELKPVYYYVVETKVTTNGTHTYVHSYDYTNKGGSAQKMEITNSIPGSLTVKKKWFDPDGEELKRGTPKQVEVELYRQTVTTTTTLSTTKATGTTTATTTTTTKTSTSTTTVDFSQLELVTEVGDNGRITIKADEDWSYTFTDLPIYGDGYKYIYYIKEVDGENYSVVYEKNTGQDIEKPDIITIKNTTDGALISVKAKKIWDIPDDLEGVEIPGSIEFQLMESELEEGGTPEAVRGEETKTANAGNKWTVEWEGLPATKYYSVQEVDLLEGWTLSGITSETTTDDEGNEVITFTVTNTIDLGNLGVEKSWYLDDDGGNTSVEVELYRVLEDNSDSAETQTVSEKSNAPKLSLQKTMKTMTSMTRATENVLYDAIAPIAEEPPLIFIDAIDDVKFSTSDASYGNWGGIPVNDVSKICADKDITSIKIEVSEPAVKGGFWHLMSRVSKADGSSFETKKFDGNAEAFGGLNIDASQKVITLNASDFGIESFKGVTGIQFAFSAQNSTTWAWSNIIKVSFYGIQNETLEIECNGKTANVDEPAIKGVEMIAGDALTITYDKPTWNDKVTSIIWTSNNESVATVKDGVVTAHSAGNVTITAEDATAKRTVEIKVNSFEIYGENGETEYISVTEGDTIPFGSNSGNGNVQWHIEDINNTGSSINGSGVFTPGTNGLTPEEDITVIVYADNNGVESNRIEVTINSKELHFEDYSSKMHAGAEQQIDVYSGNAVITDGVTWTSSNPAIATISATGLIETWNYGTTEITATRGNATATFILTVVQLTISDEELVLSLNEIKEISFTNVIGESLEWSPKSSDIVSVDSNSIIIDDTGEAKARITAKAAGEDTITFTDAAGGTVTCKVTVEIKEAVANIPSDATSLGKKTLYKDTGWSESWGDLPLTDGQGHKYKYYVKEVSTGNYIPISYSENGIYLEKGVTKTIMITNKTEKKEEPVTMPSTGGTGTTWYYITGMAFMLIPMVILVRRRKKST